MSRLLDCSIGPVVDCASRVYRLGGKESSLTHKARWILERYQSYRKSDFHFAPCLVAEHPTFRVLALIGIFTLDLVESLAWVSNAGQ